jgi:uncharacterized protein (TIGR02466 family)
MLAHPTGVTLLSFRRCSVRPDPTSADGSGTRIERVDALFPTPLVTIRVAGAEELNALLVDEIAAIRRSSAGVQRSNQGGWHSEDDLFRRPEPGMLRLRGHLIEAVRQATLAIAPAFDPARHAVTCEGWINVNGQHAFNAPHDHPGWAWSGSYYVVVPPLEPPPASPRSGAFEVFDPRVNVRAVSVDEADCFRPKFTISPVAGTAVLFPSWLKHWVYPNESPHERISIAFNARFVRREVPGG